MHSPAPDALHEPDLDRVVDLLFTWIERRLSGDAFTWVKASVDEFRSAPTDGRLYRRFGEAADRCGLDDLNLTSDEMHAADDARPGWRPVDWSIDQAIRLAMLVGTATASATDRARFGDRLDTLTRTADVREAVTLHRGLPLYPGAAAHAARAALGVRSNIKPVFEAVAHNNPYPGEAFDEGPWNQMVLKALFVGSHLDPIIGLESRANQRLTAMLRQYAGERRAASRPVSPELWRCVGIAPDAGTLGDLGHVLAEGTGDERRAAILALGTIGTDQARSVRNAAPELVAQAAEGAWGWSDLLGS